MVVIDYLAQSIVEVKPRQIKNDSYHKRQRWYNLRTSQSNKLIKQIINYAYETRLPEHKFYFVTITTQQHAAGLVPQPKFSDKRANYLLGLWLKNRAFDYVCVAERQRETTDIHYHIFIRGYKHFDIPLETGKIARIFGAKHHGSLFHVRQVIDKNLLSWYLVKYLTKFSVRTFQSACECSAYTSLFMSRTLQISQGLKNCFKRDLPSYQIKFPVTVILKNQQLFVNKYSSEYFNVFHYNDVIWQRAQRSLSLNREKLELYYQQIKQKGGGQH